MAARQQALTLTTRTAHLIQLGRVRCSQVAWRTTSLSLPAPCGARFAGYLANWL